MEILTENNGWAIVWLKDAYFVRHIKSAEGHNCGTLLRQNAHKGCNGRRGKLHSGLETCDPIIYSKFRILTFGKDLTEISKGKT